MGLDIKDYHYNYAMLQRLRQAVLDIEGITIPIMDFYTHPDAETEYIEFIDHCDCEGVYISKSSKQYDKYVKQWGLGNGYLGDLDELKKEVQKLNPLMKEKLKDNDWVLKAWVDFYNDTMSAREILEFH